MKWHKRLLRQSWCRSLLGQVAVLYIRLVFGTTRWNIVNKSTLDRFLQEKTPVIFAFWHGRLLLMPMFDQTPERTHVIISRHGDGDLIASVIQRLNIRVISGSSNRQAHEPKGAKNRGGVAALKHAVDTLKHGENIGITPDGPHGPAERVQGAIVELAKLTGVTILPVTWATSRGRRLDTWDRFWLPYPFGHGCMICGKPLTVPTNANKKTLQKAGKQLENQLNAITQEAERFVGIVSYRRS